MKKRDAVIIGAAAAGTLTALRFIRGCRLHVPIEMERETDLSPEDIINQIAHVEREPELIPFVRSVEILESGNDFARYRVCGQTYGLPWWIQYKKTWDYETGTVKWWSEKGAYGFQNVGRLTIRKADGRNIIRLDAGFSVCLPWIGCIIERTICPALHYAFGKWLDRLASGAAHE